jgi:hypothetical protein
VHLAALAWELEPKIISPPAAAAPLLRLVLFVVVVVVVAVVVVICGCFDSLDFILSPKCMEGTDRKTRGRCWPLRHL